MVIGWLQADAKRRMRFGILAALIAFSTGVVVGMVVVPIPTTITLAALMRAMGHPPRVLWVWWHNTIASVLLAGLAAITRGIAAYLALVVFGLTVGRAGAAAFAGGVPISLIVVGFFCHSLIEVPMFFLAVAVGQAVSWHSARPGLQPRTAVIALGVAVAGLLVAAVVESWMTPALFLRLSRGY